MSEFPEFDSMDPEQVERAEAADQMRREEQGAAIARVLSTYEGRLLIWHVIRHISGVDDLSFVGEAPLTNAFNEGGRRVGKEVQDLVFTAAPEQYSIMRHEAIDREERYARAVGLAEE